MRISDIEAYPVWVGHRNQLVVKVETDEGLYGWGESGLSGRDEPAAEPRAAVAGGSGAEPVPYGIVNQSDAPSCSDCGSIMIRNGACYKCPNCGGTSGCS